MKNEGQIHLGRYRRGVGRMAAEEVTGGIPLSLKCLLAAVAIVGGGYYAYKKRWIRLPRGLT